MTWVVLWKKVKTKKSWRLIYKMKSIWAPIGWYLKKPKNELNFEFCLGLKKLLFEINRNFLSQKSGKKSKFIWQEIAKYIFESEGRHFTFTFLKLNFWCEALDLFEKVTLDDSIKLEIFSSTFYRSLNQKLNGNIY